MLNGFWIFVKHWQTYHYILGTENEAVVIRLCFFVNESANQITPYKTQNTQIGTLLLQIVNTLKLSDTTFI